MKHPKFTIYKDKKGDFRFRLTAANGQIILTGEGYSAKQNAIKGIKSIKKNAENEARYVVKTASNGRVYFNLLAGNHEVIGSSQLYKSKSGVVKGVLSVMVNAPEAVIDDETDSTGPKGPKQK